MHARYPRHVSRVLLLATLLVAGSASASMVDASGASTEGETDSFPYTIYATPIHGHHFSARVTDSVPQVVPARPLALGDARSHVEADYQARHRYISGRDDHHRAWHDDNDSGRHCSDDQDPPQPTPLPGAALLFAPALLVLRLIQRRAG